MLSNTGEEVIEDIKEQMEVMGHIGSSGVEEVTEDMEG